MIDMGPLWTGSGWLTMRNAESLIRSGVSAEDAARNLAVALGRPRREVVEDPAGFRVAGTDFVTVDRVLAGAVAAEYDRIDPLTPSTYQVGEDGPEETP